MERYKGYRVPITSIKAGTLLKKLADREQTTSDDILRSAASSVPQEPKVVGPLTSTEELLEALDLAIGSDGEDLEDHEHKDSESVSTLSEAKADEPSAVIPNRKKRRTKKEMQAAAATSDEPKFVELTRLLPLLPKKGNFEVGTIKKSLYFFS